MNADACDKRDDVKALRAEAAQYRRLAAQADTMRDRMQYSRDAAIAERMARQLAAEDGRL